MRNRLTYLGALVTLAVLQTIAMGIDIALQRKIGFGSDIALLVLSLLVALRVRSSDWAAAIWAPALAWVFALLTVGQLATPIKGAFLRREVLHVAYGLAYHAWWIVGSALLAGAIAFVRHARRS